MITLREWWPYAPVGYNRSWTSSSTISINLILTEKVKLGFISPAPPAFYLYLLSSRILKRLSAKREISPGSDLLPSIQWVLPLPVAPYIKTETFTPSVKALRYGGNYKSSY